MEIIEKQVEKVKEVPTDGYYGYGRRAGFFRMRIMLRLTLKSKIW